MRKFYIVIIALLSFFTITIVKADTLPAFNLRVTENENFELQMFNDMTYIEFFDEVIALESDYYEILINPVVLNSDSTSYRIQLALIPKSLPFPLSTLNYSPSGNEFYIGYTFPISSYKYYSISPNVNLSINNMTDYTNFKNCYLNGVCTGYNQYDITSTFYRGRNYNASNSYDNELAQRGYVIYSSLPIPITYSSNFSAKFSSFSVNGTLIENNDYIPTYYDLFGSQPEPDPEYTIETSASDYTNILVGNITNLHDFRLNINFLYDNYDYVNNSNAYFRIYGRKTNTNTDTNSTYYSYDDISYYCSAINGNKLNKAISTSPLKYAEFSYFSQGISCGNLDLTQYDNYYLAIQTYAVNSGVNYISNLEYYVSNGNFYYSKSDAYNIYDTYTQLPHDFSILITNSYSKVATGVKSDNHYIIGCPVNLYKMEISTGCPNPSYIGSDTNYGYMIYQYPNDDTSSVELSILTSFDSIVSFGSNGVNANSSYDYYDINGDIENSTINNNLVLNYQKNDYDISNYLDYVKDFLEDFRDDINSFAYLVQNFYDTMPIYFQTFIYCAFILLLVWALYLLIRRF